MSGGIALVIERSLSNTFFTLIWIVLLVLLVAGVVLWIITPVVLISIRKELSRIREELENLRRNGS